MSDLGDLELPHEPQETYGSVWGELSTAFGDRADEYLNASIITKVNYPNKRTMYELNFSDRTVIVDTGNPEEHSIESGIFNVYTQYTDPAREGSRISLLTFKPESDQITASGKRKIGNGTFVPANTVTKLRDHLIATTGIPSVRKFDRPPQRQ